MKSVKGTMEGCMGSISCCKYRTATIIINTDTISYLDNKKVCLWRVSEAFNFLKCRSLALVHQSVLPFEER
jgi:hypothetical protein